MRFEPDFPMRTGRAARAQSGPQAASVWARVRRTLTAGAELKR